MKFTSLTDETLKEEIRLKSDIVSTVGRYVKLLRAGQNFKGLCPFHKEKTPSFTVTPDKGIFHCFGCGKGGDIFTFLMEIEGLTFPETLEKLADENGIDYKVLKSKKQWNEKQPEGISKNRALDIHKWACYFYYEQMKKSIETIEYFKKRGISSQSVKELQLGFAPAGWNNLHHYLGQFGVSDQEMIHCGLVLQSQEGRVYDRFRNRVIFSICDITGKVIAFAGRAFEVDAKPKYLNSPETILYKKNRLLYGLFYARQQIKNNNLAIFVEGYMDFIALYQRGIQNVVATSGTALTEDHGHIISRFTSRVILLFDGDGAGQKAAERAVFVLSPLNIDVKILILPDNHDPDSYVQEYGKENFLKHLDKAVAAHRFLIEYKQKLVDSTTPSGKSEIASYLKEYISSIGDTITRSAIIKDIAERLRVNESLLLEEFRRRKQRETVEISDNIPIQGIDQFAQSEEGSILHILLKNPHLIEMSKVQMDDGKFLDSFSENVYSSIIESYERDGTVQGVIDHFQGNPVITYMLAKDVISDNIEDDLLHKIKKCKIKTYTRLKQEITQRIKTETELSTKRELLKRQTDLIQKILEIS